MCITSQSKSKPKLAAIVLYNLVSAKPILSILMFDMINSG